MEVDFKINAEAVKPEDLVAFANAGGGVILVGVAEKRDPPGSQRGNVIGCDVGDRERNKIISRANACRPAIPVKTLVETHGKLYFMRVDIPKGGLHCTSNGTYKIRRDGQTDIIDPSYMVEIIVRLEHNRIIGKLREAFGPDLDALLAQSVEASEAQTAIEDLHAEIDVLKGQMDDDRDWD
jgi:predicted HTH transcriptional regulator